MLNPSDSKLLSRRKDEIGLNGFEEKDLQKEILESIQKIKTLHDNKKNFNVKLYLYKHLIPYKAIFLSDSIFFGFYICCFHGKYTTYFKAVNGLEDSSDKQVPPYIYCGLEIFARRFFEMPYDTHQVDLDKIIHLEDLTDTVKIKDSYMPWPPQPPKHLHNLCSIRWEQKNKKNEK